MKRTKTSRGRVAGTPRGRYASRRWARSMSRSFAETWRESGRTYLPVAALAVHEWLHAQIGRAMRHGEQLVRNAWCSVRTRHRAAAAAGSDGAGHRARRHGLDAQETSRRGVHQGSVARRGAIDVRRWPTTTSRELPRLAPPPPPTYADASAAALRA